MKTMRLLVAFCVLGFSLEAQVSFKLSSSPGVTNGPNMVAVADVNGDGEMDLICVQYYGGSVTVLTNDGHNSFELSGTYPVGGLPYAVVEADVNGDGWPDFITANSASASSSLSVYTNNGTGGFVLSGTYPVGLDAIGVTAADVNGDGKVDLISANWGGFYGHTLTVLTNNGSGGFVTSSSPVVGDSPMWAAAADVNGDGKVDLISANRSDNSLAVLTNDGSGGFVLAATNAVGSDPVYVAAADVNGDGKADLISANWDHGAGNTLTVLTNNGNGGFVLSSSPVVGRGVIAVTAADVNGDGWVDLISVNNGDSTLSVLTNNGTGGFMLATNLSVGTGPNWVAAADINGDDKVDLISANGGNDTLSVLTNATPYTVTPCGPIATATAITDNGFVVRVFVVCGGYGYTNTPSVRFVGGGGSGAQAVAVVSNGMVTAVNVLDAGSGYTNAPLVVIGPPYTFRPVLSVARVAVLSFSGLNVGSRYQLQQSSLWYWTNQLDSFTATNAVFTRVLTGPVGGGDYRLAPAPAPAQAFATAQMANGFVYGATVTSGGSGYLSPPAVSIVGGGGSGATAIAQISAGAVTNIQPTAAGAGYTNLPTVEIAPPPVTALTPAILPGMRLEATNLVPYDTYQMQFTPDVAGGWTSWAGGSFTPTGTTHSLVILIPSNAGFFRLEYVP